MRWRRDIANTQVPADLRQVDAFHPVSESGVAADHKQTDLAQQTAVVESLMTPLNRKDKPPIRKK